jgi:hypothetical protein
LEFDFKGFLKKLAPLGEKEGIEVALGKEGFEFGKENV